jgi:cytochrome b6-f complex iron-sulfur subunit
MSEPKKPSTADILAQLRKEKAGGSAGAAPAQPAAPPPADAPADEPTATPASAAAAPKSTADILAAARAKKATGEAPAAGGAPKSTADILAAARAKAGAGTAAPAAAAKPAPIARAPLPSEIAALPPGDKPSVEAMLKAVRSGEPMPTAPAKPKLPSKPPIAAKAKGETRRSFLDTVLSPFYVGFGVLGAWFGISSLATARFMMPNTVLELPSKFKVGSAGDYPMGTVSEKYKASRGIWIVHTDSYDGRNQVYALSTVCTHLGCTPNWLDAEQKFKCPCHGSGFYINGINFEGPAPRPLERVGLRVSEDGQLEVDKSVKFQEELGQWGDEKSFVLLT